MEDGAMTTIRYSTETEVSVETMALRWHRGSSQGSDTLDGNIYAYKRVAETKDSRPDVDVILAEQQGFVNAQGLKELLQGFTPTPVDSLSNFMILSDDLLSHIHRFGYAGLHAKGFKGLDNVKVYDHLKQDGSLNNIVRIDPNNNSFWHVDGKIIPTGIYFDYISARMNDGCYNLKKALTILSQRGDITFASPNDKDAKNNARIHNIPAYNQSEGYSQSLNFFWTPSQEQAEMLVKCRTTSYQMIFEQDMLGLRAGGAALFNDFYKSREDQNYNKFDDDDDDFVYSHSF
jgi:hypothetical protein